MRCGGARLLWWLKLRGCLQRLNFLLYQAHARAQANALQLKLFDHGAQLGRACISRLLWPGPDCNCHNRPIAICIPASASGGVQARRQAQVAQLRIKAQFDVKALRVTHLCNHG